MKKHAGFCVGGVVLVAATLLVTAQVVSQEKAPPKPPGDAEVADMMAKWKAMNAKRPEHKKFERMVGTWDTETRMWMSPDSEPTVSKGAAEFRLILDGRYGEQKFKCTLPHGTLEGLCIEGYDVIKKKYVSIWMDNSSTGIFLMEGTSDESGKVTTYYGKMDDPMTGQKDKVVKSVAREINEDKVIFEMYDRPPKGEEFKTMEVTYTRRK